MDKLKSIAKELGKDYRMKHIDLENCIYRNFGNNFDVEVSAACSHTKGMVIAYLWFDVGEDGNRQSPLIVTSRKVDATAAEIKKAVEELKALSEEFVAKGLNNRKSVIEYREADIKHA